MRHDIAILDDDYRYMKHYHMHDNIYSVLFKKLVTAEEYPMLAKAKDDQEDLTVTPEEAPGLKADLDKLENYLKSKGMMSEEVLDRCMGFIAVMREFCAISTEQGRNIEFIAGE